jgi:hypothetical protein
MISFNSPNISQQSHTGILSNQHITVQAAAKVEPITGSILVYLWRIRVLGELMASSN